MARPGNRLAMRLWLLASTVLVAATFASSSSASPSVQFGVQDDAWLLYGPGSMSRRIDRLHSLGVGVVRINVEWYTVERRKGVFDWTGYDGLVDGLHQKGIQPVLTLVGTPGWANGGKASNVAPLSGGSFAAFARAAAKHYPFVKRWLIWNEPNQRRNLLPTSPAVYTTRLLNPAYAAIHSVIGGALVGGGVTAPRGNTGGVSPVAWIAGMAKAHARLDAYAHNPYPLQPKETPFTGGCDTCDTITMATLPKLIAETKRDFGAKTRIWLSEYGYQTDPPDTLAGVSDAKQALYVGEAALRAYEAPRVDLLIQYLVQDEPELGRWQSGVLTVTGTPKPSYHALELPLALKGLKGERATLWGQVRPGGGRRHYRLEELRAGKWRVVGGLTATTPGGFFQRVVHATKNAQFRVVQPSTGDVSETLTVA